jgi:nucleoside diphosphate kinase
MGAFAALHSSTHAHLCGVALHARVRVQALAAKHYAEHDGKPFFPKVCVVNTGWLVALGVQDRPLQLAS